MFPQRKHHAMRCLLEGQSRPYYISPVYNSRVNTLFMSMKVTLIISENKTLERILPKTDLVLFRYQDKSKKLWNNWSKASRAARAGVLAFGMGGEAVATRLGQPEGGKALGHPQLPHASKEGIEKMDPCGGRKRDNGHKLKQETFRLDVQKIFSTTRAFMLPQKAEMSPSLEVFKQYSGWCLSSTEKHHLHIILGRNQYQNMLTQLPLLYPPPLTGKKHCQGPADSKGATVKRHSRCRS